MKIKSLFLICAFLLVSCNKKEDEDAIKPSAELFQEAEGYMQKKKYKDAAKTYSRIYFQDPGSEDAAKAELSEARALYEANKYYDAVDVIDDFLHLHPKHMDSAYALHLKALCYYMMIPNVYREQGVSQKAMDVLSEVITQYPETEYAKDAKEKFVFVQNHLAGKEMEIGRLYIRKYNPMAAISRFQNVLKKYETSVHTPEALYRLSAAHLMLGLDQEAQKYKDALMEKYLDNKWAAMLQKMWDEYRK